ncbi:hypothetical protein HMPREF9554_01190 [Treponema phagedenis F0421]|nr:hypothetical protein HMPREF9554_01190 [Treponema phagedenis F0421]
MPRTAKSDSAFLWYRYGHQNYGFYSSCHASTCTAGALELFSVSCYIFIEYDSVLVCYGGLYD